MAGSKKRTGGGGHKRTKPQTQGKPSKPDGHATGGRKAFWEKVLWRYLAATVVLSVMYGIYRLHPYYQRTMFKPWFPFFEKAYFGWLAIGPFYVAVTLSRFGGFKMDMTDGAMHWTLIFRGVLNFLVEGCRWPRWIWSNRRVRTTVLSLGVKGFFTPLMWVFLSEHLHNMQNMWFRRKGVELLTDAVVTRLNGMGIMEGWLPYWQDVLPRLMPTWPGVVDSLQIWNWTAPDMSFGFDFYYQLLFFVDCIWAFTGYAAESRWLDNKTKSVEPTGFGWMVALMCYPPFNDVSGTYFPLGRAAPLFHDPTLIMACRALMLAAFTIYVWATLAFGPRFSNLTHRGIITRGPYRFIRHPAYACKNFAWWMEYLPYANGWTVLWLIAWNTIYSLRAWTEERHLSRDPVYREYQKKVPWKVIPGIW